MSATYRHSSKNTPDLLQRDPETRLLARGPSVRLPAEVIRDQALAIAGLLVNKIGGPSVYPYPEGIWRELNMYEDYKQGEGEDSGLFSCITGHGTITPDCRPESAPRHGKRTSPAQR